MRETKSQAQKSRQYADASVFLVDELARDSISYDNVNINVKGYLSFDKIHLAVEPSEMRVTEEFVS